MEVGEELFAAVTEGEEELALELLARPVHSRTLNQRRNDQGSLVDFAVRLGPRAVRCVEGMELLWGRCGLLWRSGPEMCGRPAHAPSGFGYHAAPELRPNSPAHPIWYWAPSLSLRSASMILQ